MFGPLTRISPSSAILISQPGNGLPTVPHLEGIGGRDRRRGRGLGHPPALDHEDPGGVEELEDLRVDRRRAGDRLLEVAAEQRRGSSTAPACRRSGLEREQRAGPLALALERPDLLADPDRPVEDRLLEPALLLDRRGRGRVDLLEDPRHRREVGRLDLGEVGDDLQRVALPVGEGAADGEAQSWISSANECASGRKR